MILLALMQAGVPSIEDLTGRPRVSQTNFPQLLIVLGAVTLVALVALVWAAFIRKKPRHKHRHHWKSGNAMNESSSATQESSGRRRRRSKSASRPRNPTLAETHGLPPVREDPPPPSYN